MVTEICLTVTEIWLARQPRCGTPIPPFRTAHNLHYVKLWALLQGAPLVQILFPESGQADYRDSLVGERDHILPGCSAMDRSVWGVLVVDPPRFRRELVTNIVGAGHQRSDQLAVGGNNLRSRQRCGHSPRAVDCGGGHLPANGNGRRHPSNLLVVALRTTDEMPIDLGFKVGRTLKPALKAVIVRAKKVVDDHSETPRPLLAQLVH